MYICAHNKAMRSACLVYWEITGRKKKGKWKRKSLWLRKTNIARQQCGNWGKTSGERTQRQEDGIKKKKSTGSRGCLQSLHPQLLLHCQYSKEFELFVLNTVHFFFLLFFLRKTACGATAIEGDFQSACLLLSHGMKNHSKLRFHAATGERRMKLTSFFSLLSKIICKLFRSILNPQTCSFFFLYDRHLSLSVVR